MTGTVRNGTRSDRESRHMDSATGVLRMRGIRRQRAAFGAAFLVLAAGAITLYAADQPAQPAAKPAAVKIVPLNKQETVLLDRAGRRVLVKAKVVLREGLLEMLACP